MSIDQNSRGAEGGISIDLKFWFLFLFCSPNLLKKIIDGVQPANNPFALKNGSPAKLALPLKTLIIRVSTLAKCALFFLSKTNLPRL